MGVEVGEQMSAVLLSQQDPLNEETFCSIFGILGLTCKHAWAILCLI